MFKGLIARLALIACLIVVVCAFGFWLLADPVPNKVYGLQAGMTTEEVVRLMGPFNNFQKLGGEDCWLAWKGSRYEVYVVILEGGATSATVIRYPLFGEKETVKLFDK
jgi:hypothetical protein